VIQSNVQVGANLACDNANEFVRQFYQSNDISPGGGGKSFMPTTVVTPKRYKVEITRQYCSTILYIVSALDRTGAKLTGDPGRRRRRREGKKVSSLDEKKNILI